MSTKWRRSKNSSSDPTMPEMTWRDVMVHQVIALVACSRHLEIPDIQMIEELHQSSFVFLPFFTLVLTILMLHCIVGFYSTNCL